MKVSRNDPCPCGSGKKYKKCCLDKHISNKLDVNTVSIEKSKSDFEHIEDTSKKIEQIISQYNIDDVTKAIFCINAWANNRSALAQTLTLNMSISNTPKFDNKNIKEFSELKAFFNEISCFLPITPREDLTLNDFGEVKLIIEGEVFPVILGTGHEQVYAAMNYLPILSRVINMTDDLKVVLGYNRKIINELTLRNISSTDYKITLELPSEQFWNDVKCLIDSKEFLEHMQKVFPIMGYQKCPIEMRHFFIYRENPYPLYNSSILVDFYKKLLTHATENECHEHINLTIGEFTENTFNCSENTRTRVLIAPTIINRDTGKPYTGNHLTFLTVSTGKMIIAINKGDFEDLNIIKAEISLINDLHKKNELSFREMLYRKESHGGYACNVPPDMPIQFLMIEPFTDISAHGAFFGEDGQEFTCTALDLIYMLGFMEDFDEILEFIEYEKAETAQIMTIGGISNLFFMWKNAHRQIASGAVEYTFISAPYGSADDYVYEYYKKTLINYPLKFYSKMFCNPLHWNIKDDDFGYSLFLHKGYPGFGGQGKVIGASTFLFLTHNVEFFTREDFEPDKHVALRTIDELNQRLFNRYAEKLAIFPLLNQKALQVMYLPMHYAKRVDRSGFTRDKNKKYVYSDIHVDMDAIIIQYSVNLDELLSAMMEAKDKSVESTYFLELIDPLKKYLKTSFVDLEEMVKRDSKLKKEVGVFAIKQDYYYSDMAPSFHMKALNFVKARKEIAKVCYASGAVPGEYRGQEATRVIRKMQTAIVKVFENQISQYDIEYLNKLALNNYSAQLHGIIINLKRYSSFNDLEPSIQQDFEKKTRNIREEYRRNLRTAQYLLESNLAIQRQGTIKECRRDEFENLLAFADWLVVLQDNADNCYFTDFDLSISVDNEFKVDTIINETSELQSDEMLLRKYKQEDYTIKNDDTDRNFLISCGEAFFRDTGVELDVLISLILYLQLEVIKKPFVKEVYPNVFEVIKKDLIHGFITDFFETKEDNLKKTENALNFITLVCEKLKFLNGTNHDVLPVWDRENRDNRLEVKPIILIGGNCIFSPVVMNQLATMWQSGFIEWYLPFEIGLENVKIEIAKWKKRYEDEMVQDIAAEFINKGFHPVLPEADLISRYPACGFPDDLGDYDVIAVNQSKKEMWLIESKVLQKVGSIYELQMQQKSFFYQHKDDEKFQKRIDYIKDNLNKVISLLGLEAGEYSVVPYMVTNKLFVSRYKELKFPIITYHELMRKLEDY